MHSCDFSFLLFIKERLEPQALADVHRGWKFKKMPLIWVGYVEQFVHPQTLPLSQTQVDTYSSLRAEREQLWQ